MTMKLYAVRFRGSHEAVGFFYVESLEALTIMVDQLSCDPCTCEYREIDACGAIHWPGAGVAWKMGERDGHPDKESESYFCGEGDAWYDEREAEIRKGVEFSGSVADYLMGDKIKGWKPLPEYMLAMERLGYIERRPRKLELAR
jgi:hypothetical protein